MSSLDSSTESRGRERRDRVRGREKEERKKEKGGRGSLRKSNSMQPSLLRAPQHTNILYTVIYTLIHCVPNRNTVMPTSAYVVFLFDMFRLGLFGVFLFLDLVLGMGFVCLMHLV